jgi:hypothetical protein
MEVNGQLHTLAGSPLGKELWIPIVQEAGWALELVLMLWRRKILPLLGIEP